MMNKQSITPQTILWADDDVDDLLFVRHVVEAAKGQLRLEEVGNGKEVMDYLKAIPCPSEFPCLVVLDINMPLLNGKETLTQIKKEEKYKDLLVAVFTTSSSAEDRAICQQYNVPMITKPLTYREFADAVTGLLQLCSFDDLPPQSLS